MFSLIFAILLFGWMLIEGFSPSAMLVKVAMFGIDVGDEMDGEVSNCKHCEQNYYGDSPHRVA